MFRIILLAVAFSIALLFLLNLRANMRKRAFMAAAHKGDLDLLKKLLGKGINVNTRMKYFGWTALMLAALKGHTDCVVLLLEKGADVNSKSRSSWRFMLAGHDEYRCGVQYRSGRTALMNAALNGHLDVVRLLLHEGADANARTNTGWTALMAAASKGHAEVVRALLENGADVNVRDYDYDMTALEAAASRGYTNIVQMLEEVGANKRPT